MREHEQLRARNDGRLQVGAGLANVDPIFTSVRLAQRIPVRIHKDRIPPDVKVVAGQTGTVVVTPPRKPQSSLTSK